jgi:hypothetical protein
MHVTADVNSSFIELKSSPIASARPERRDS